jgi:prolyl oligopeptidase
MRIALAIDSKGGPYVSRRFIHAGLPALLLLALCVSNTQGQATVPPPVAAKHPLADEYHGIKVVEDYRWLEDSKSAETRQWLAAENAYSQVYFQHAAAWTSVLRDLKSPKENPGATQRRLDFREGRFFYLQLDRTRQQRPVLMTSTSLGTSNSPPANAKVLLDPTVLDPTGHTSIDWYKPSLDGSLIAVGLAVGGSERSALTVFQTSTGKQVGTAFVPMGFGAAGRSVAWLPGNKGFLYAGYPPAVAAAAQSTVLQNQKVFEHILGNPESEDRVVLDEGLTRLAQIALESDPTGKWIVASAEDGDGGKYANYVRRPDGSWRQISTYSDQIVAITPGTPEEDALYLTSLKDAPRGKILKVSANSPSLADAKVIIPEGTASLEHDDPDRDSHRFVVTRTRLYVTTIDGGPNRLRAYDHGGRFLGDVPLTPLTGVSEVVHLGDESLAIRTSEFLTPTAYFTYQPGPDAQLQATALSRPASRILAGYAVDQAFATSKDGTKIPMSIIHRRGSAMDGTVPTLVYGYGGYGISLSPAFVDNTNWHPWLQQGYTLVITNIRGGAEYGEQWHMAGNLTRKQNVFDDFSACAQYLADHHWSSPTHMAALGGSNGGLLMGAEITQHPEQFRAVVSQVGIYDMLRVELDANGQFNTTEYGTVKDAAQFQALYAYSPYHHVVDGEKYPAVLMETGDNDPRVNPAQSRKFTARLQAANGSSYPILLKTFANAGHGASSSADVEEQTADTFAFLFQELGVTYAPAP